MLSQLLRRLLLGQLVSGAVLGWLIARQMDITPWLAAGVALALPFTTVLVVVLISAIKSRTAGANALWWRSMLGEYWAITRVFLLHLPWAGAPKVLIPAPHVALRTPVVLVHGYMCNHRIWDGMSRRLRSAGHPVLGVDLEPLLESIDSYAPLLEHAVEALRLKTGAPQVILIGHSMGGLVIRAWMRAHGHDRVARVITLGTPHAGTQIAPRTKAANGLQMCWRSPWLQDLVAGETPASRSLMRIAITAHDHIVYPQRDQVLPEVPVTVFDGLGHIELCLNSAVIDWVLQQLDDAAPR